MLSRSAWIALAVLIVAIAALALWLRLHLTIPSLVIPRHATDAERVERIDAWLRELHQRNKFNGGVLMARGGDPLLMRTYGVADHEATTTLSVTSAFRLASVSKQFTAVGVLILVEEGVLSLEDPISRYLEQLSFPGVAIIHLLQHTSGIPDVYLRLATQRRTDLGDILRIRDVPRLLALDPPPAESTPGARFSYSNTNYVLLAALIERVTGQSFESFLQRRLFHPLGMKDSRVWNRASTAPFPNRVEDFEQIGSERRLLPPSWIDGVAGDGGVHTSLRDLLRWDAFWREDPTSPILLSPALRQAAITPPRLEDGSHSNYGFGLVVGTDQIAHNGSWLGARTLFVRYPASESCLAILDNSANPRFDQIARVLVDAFEPLHSGWGNSERHTSLTIDGSPDVANRD